MTLVACGRISAVGNATRGGLNESVAEEMGRAAGATFSFAESDARALAGKPTGAISLSDFYGKTFNGGYIYGPGTWCFIAPAYVTKVSAVGIGGGGAGGTFLSYATSSCCFGTSYQLRPGAGGSGGGLAYGNNITVNSGSSYYVEVGSGGAVGVQGYHGNSPVPSACTFTQLNNWGSGNRTVLCFGAGGQIVANGGIGGTNMQGFNGYYTQYPCGCYSPWYYMAAPGGTASSTTVTGGAYKGGAGGLQSGYGIAFFLPYAASNFAGIVGGSYTAGSGYAAGGGGTGGYSGAGGNAGNGNAAGSSAANGGGGGGGGAATRSYTGSGGGGTEVYAPTCCNPTLKTGTGGANAVGGTWGGVSVSGTTSYHATSGSNSTNTSTRPNGGKYGAGGGGGRCGYVSGTSTFISGISHSWVQCGGLSGVWRYTFNNNQTTCYWGYGGDGVARIIWSGSTRSFPTTKTGNPNTTVYGTA